MTLEKSIHPPSHTYRYTPLTDVPLVTYTPTHTHTDTPRPCRVVCVCVADRHDSRRHTIDPPSFVGRKLECVVAQPTTTVGNHPPHQYTDTHTQTRDRQGSDGCHALHRTAPHPAGD
mmetsp:Transcript_30460/g.75622  ORF Transcript_30460/g.75622 Transcript_30460/m.75622 type:complete len:117 (-) Transcript_30460:137-487(-)